MWRAGKHDIKTIKFPKHALYMSLDNEYDLDKTYFLIKAFLKLPARTLVHWTDSWNTFTMSSVLKLTCIINCQSPMVFCALLTLIITPTLFVVVVVVVLVVVFSLINTGASYPHNTHLYKEFLYCSY